MDNNRLKFYLIFAIVMILVSYFTQSYLLSLLGTISYVVPGLVGCASLYLSTKISKTKVD